MLTIEDINRMKEVRIEDVNIEKLTDLRDIVIDTSKSVNYKLNQVAVQTDNLYINRFDDYIVKVTYADTNQTIDDRMRSHVSHLAEINY